MIEAPRCPRRFSKHTPCHLTLKRHSALRGAVWSHQGGGAMWARAANSMISPAASVWSRPPTLSSQRLTAW
jgi:hypothetical protein